MALSLFCCSAYRSKQVAHTSESIPCRTPKNKSRSRHGTNATFLEMVGSKVSNGSERVSTEKEITDEQAANANLDGLAEKLTKVIRKYPKSSKSFMKHPKERFLAVIPAADDKGTGSLDRWKNGYLAYWETRDDFQIGAPPKGRIGLMRIAKVQHLHEHNGCGVSIKHKPDEAFQEMVILLESQMEAGQFTYVLWEFICKLRGRWNLTDPESS